MKETSTQVGIDGAGSDVVEFGPVNATIHKVNEHVKAEDVVTLSRVYERIMQLLLLGADC